MSRPHALRGSVLLAAIALVGMVIAAPAVAQSPGASGSPAPPMGSPLASPGASAAPSGSGTPSASPSPSGSPAATGSPSASAGVARVIELEEDAALQILMDGQKVTELAVTVGETITFRVTNTAGYLHNLYIGTDEQLKDNQVEGLPGVPDFAEGTQEFTWTVPPDVTSLKFGCTVPGHYQLMQGTFTVAG
jgi:hypothetical protein